MQIGKQTEPVELTITYTFTFDLPCLTDSFACGRVAIPSGLKNTEKNGFENVMHKILVVNEYFTTNYYDYDRLMSLTKNPFS